MKGFLVVLLALACLLLQTQALKSYKGYSVIRVDERLFQYLEKIHPDIDIWQEHDGKYDVVVSPHIFERISMNHKLEVVFEDIQELIDNQFKNASAPWTKAGTKNGFFDTFHTYDEFWVYVDDLIAQYPNYLSKSSIGKSIEGRELVLVKLTTGGQKEVVWIESTTHAREWLAPTTSLYALTTLVEGYSSGDATATKLLDSFEWNFVLFLNPDGYTYSWTNDRLWRKNRRQNQGSNFYGVDLNRNWGPNSTWCTSGSSTNPASDTYCGTSAFSEPETAAASNTLLTLQARIKGLIAYHTYGPLLLRPFQYTYDKPSEPYNTEMTNLGKNMETTINSVHGAKYESIQGSSLYPHSGGTIDWAYLNFDIPAFTIEIRGNSFIVPDSEIILAGEENYAGLVVFGEYLLTQ